MEGDITKNLVFLFRGQKETDEKDRFENELISQGYKPVNVSVLSFKYSKLQEMCEKLKHINDFAAVVFTSPRSAEALLKAKELLEGDDAANFKPKEVPSYVVGKGTKAIVEKIGFSPKGEDTGNAEALANLIADEVSDKDKPFLFPCGSLKRDVLITKLKGKEFSVQTITVYETDANPNFKDDLTVLLEKHGLPEFMVFFSPSGVRYSKEHLHTCIKDLSSIKFAAIGPTSKDELLKQEFVVHGTAEKPNPDSLVKALQSQPEDKSEDS